MSEAIKVGGTNFKILAVICVFMSSSDCLAVRVKEERPNSH